VSALNNKPAIRDLTVIALVVLAMLLVAYDRFGPERAISAAVPSVADAPPAPAGASQTTSANIPAVQDKSIAVLPFVNMSGDVGNEYFSDGISEEILNVLARTPDLQVAARTSSFAYKGKEQDIPQIARELQVRMVLEGSVRKQEDRVRITAQLIDAKTGFHVWSQAYDRKLADIFEIQDEIARAIGDELKVRIGGTDVPGAPARGTANLEAYDAYLRGLALWQERRGQPLWDAIAQFEQAVAADPGFAQAYAGLALVYAVIPDYSTRIGYRESYKRATDAAHMALALDPSQPEAYAVLASVSKLDKSQRATSYALFRRAIALRPSFATAHQWLGTELMAGGDPAAGLESSSRAATLDPRSRVIAQNRAVVLTALGRYAEARAECDRALGFAPDYDGCHWQNGFDALLQGDLEAAGRHLRRTSELNGTEAGPLIEAILEALAGRGDRRAVAQRLAAFPTLSYLNAGSGSIFSYYETPSVLVKLGEPGLALDYLARHAARESTAEWPLMIPALDPIRCGPRFKALIKQLNTVDPHAARVCKG
jgi:TolB-like protein/Tfp pilus assembly protein PilF